MEFEELLIWADDGAWFQYRDEYGRVRTSFLGFCDSALGLERFALEHGIAFQLFSSSTPSNKPDADKMSRHRVRRV
jgi:hypothetical protein